MSCAIGSVLNADRICRPVGKECAHGSSVAAERLGLAQDGEGEWAFLSFDGEEIYPFRRALLSSAESGHLTWITPGVYHTSPCDTVAATTDDLLASSRRLVTRAANTQAEARAIRATVRETVAAARNWRQVGLFRRAIRKRLAQLAADSQPHKNG